MWNCGIAINMRTQLETAYIHTHAFLLLCIGCILVEHWSVTDGVHEQDVQPASPQTSVMQQNAIPARTQSQSFTRITQPPVGLIVQCDAHARFARR
jgi:hypothetical protein